MWNSYRVPKSGQIAKKSSTYQILIKTLMGRSWRAGMNPFSSKTLRHQVWERRLWHFESKNRSRAKGRFGHPRLGVAQYPRPSDVFGRLRESISKPPNKAAHEVNWLQVFKRAHTALLGFGGGPE